MKYSPAVIDDAPLLPAIERSSGELFRQWPQLAWIAGEEVQSEARHREFIEAEPLGHCYPGEGQIDPAA